MSAAPHHDTCHHRIYFLSCDDLDALWEYAEGACQICRTPEADTKRGRLVIDHLSDYGAHMVRGLLCDRCNSLMSRIDSNRPIRRSRAVLDYMSNAWCSRKLNPRGIQVRYASPGFP